MKLSIVTVCYNSASTIRDAVESVLSQEGVELEYIVIDGGSTDETVEILKGYGDRISCLVSEPDEGIYDAMNKGVSLATGEVVGILNSDDFYANDQVLSQVAAVFEGAGGASPLNHNLTPNPNLEAGASSRAPTAHGGNDGTTPSRSAIHPSLKRRGASEDDGSVAGASSRAPTVDCVFGDLDFVDATHTDQIVRAWRSKPYVAGAFKRGWHPAHPTFFVRRSVYERCGLFDTRLKIAADYEFMLRVLERDHASSVYVPEVFVKMRMGGASTGSLKNILKANLECWKAWRQNGLGWSPLPVLAKPLSKLKQLRARRAI